MVGGDVGDGGRSDHAELEADPVGGLDKGLIGSDENHFADVAPISPRGLLELVLLAVLAAEQPGAEVEYAVEFRAGTGEELVELLLKRQVVIDAAAGRAPARRFGGNQQIGRASCRERVCLYV